MMAEQAQVALRLCMTHSGEEMELYCKVCKKPICNECMKSEHMGHDFDTIAKFYRKIKNSRPELIREFERKITPKQNHNRRHLHEVKSMNKSLFEMNLDNVEKKRREMYDAVDKIINAHVDSIKSHNAGLGAEIKTEEDKIMRDESTLLRMIETFRKTTMTGLDLIEYYEDLKTKADALQTEDLSHYRNKQLYMDGFVVIEDLAKMIGDMKEIDSSEIGTEEISCFQHKDTDIVTIYPISREKAWFTYWNAKEFTLLQQDGHHIESVPKDMGTHSFIMQNNAFLLCNQEGTTIFKIDSSGKISVWVNVEPLLPRFIGHTLHDTVLVSVVDDLFAPRTVESQRKVQMMSLSGKVLRTYEYGDDGTTPVFTFPGRVTQNYNSDVCVVN